MIVKIVAGHAKIEAVLADDGVEVLFKLIANDDDVVTDIEHQAGALVVGQQAVTNPRVFIAMVEMNAIAAVVTDGDAVQEDLIDVVSQNSVAALLVASDTQVLQLDAPQSGSRVGLSLGIIDFNRRLAACGDVLDVGRGAAALNENVFLRNSQRLGDFERSRGQMDDAASWWQGVNGSLERCVVRRVDRRPSAVEFWPGRRRLAGGAIPGEEDDNNNRNCGE